MVSTGCFSIEQEVFLQPDGSGELLLHFSLPDFPEELRKESPMKTGDPATMVESFKAEVIKKLPPTIQLKEVKENKRNGAHDFYAFFHFKTIKDVEALMTQTLKESTKDSETKASQPVEWQINWERRGAATHFSQRFSTSIPETKGPETKGPEAKGPDGFTGGARVTKEPTAENDSPPPPAKLSRTRSTGRTTTKRQTSVANATKPSRSVSPPASSQDDANPFADLSKQLEPLIYSMIKFRFVVHAPSAITSANADIILNGKTAVWNASLGAFAKEKKAIEMNVVY